MEYKTTIRITALLAAVVIVIGAFIGRLYQIQVTQAENVVSSTDTYPFLTHVTAARGNILDRNGTVLVSNRASYNLTINDYIIYSTQNTNQNILTLVNKCNELELEYADHLPISQQTPYVSTYEDLSTNWQGYFKTYMSERDWDLDMTATSLMKQLRETYRVPEDWSDEDARKVVGIRYELELRHYVYAISTYVLCYDISPDDLATIIELSIPGVNVETTTVRQYNTTYAAHILGSVGKMTAEEYETYKELGYSMDAYVGKEGFELAFEDQLHGTDGEKRTVLSSSGEVLEETYTKEPQAGNNVELTIDLDLQMVSENALASHIENVRENGISSSNNDNDGTGKDAEGGAVVVISCKEDTAGEVLACASYPTYNLATYSEDFQELLEDPYAPLYNRALQAIYNPGSTFKMVTGIAAVDYLGFNPQQGIEDEGVYTYYEDEGFTPKCMVYKNYGVNHGLVDLRRALTVSCNYYFYEVANQIYYKFNHTIAPIDEVAKAMGLGESTGVELTEAVGYRANAETKAKLYNDDQSGFYGADALMAAIGQSENKFTVLQLATYVATLANQGTRYRSTFLQRVLSADFSTLVKQNTPEIVNQLDISEEAMSAIHDGMVACATDGAEGTARSTFLNYQSETGILVAAKTGTAEHDAGGSSHASFVCYAPADDPEIAIAIYVEKGGSGSSLGPIAKAILDAYFAEDTSSETTYAEGRPN